MALTYTPKQLIQAILGNAIGTIFTATKKVIVKEIILCNRSASSVTIDMAILANAETLDNKNYIFSTMAILPAETKIISLSTVIEINGFIQAVCSANSAVSVTISGVEIE